MTVTQEQAVDSVQHLETPFAENFGAADQIAPAIGFLPWTQEASPFAESIYGEAQLESESEQIIAEAYETLRDEAFDEALAELIAETSEAADTRLHGEQPLQLSQQRRQLADNHLAPIALEAEKTLSRFIDHVRGADVEGLASDQIDEVLDRFDVGAAAVSPAGEQFIGGLLNKARNAVKAVASAAGRVAATALPILGPLLNKLKALVQPMLRRVLQSAINKLPSALHEPARALAAKVGVPLSEAVSESEAEGIAMSPVTAFDPTSLAESFDAALAESVLGGEALEQGESFGHDLERGAEPEAGSQLEGLADARAAFMESLQAAGDNENIGPAVEQFVPAILSALRFGVRLVGRPRVVNFLTDFLTKVIGQWVGPTQSQPLSRAIVDVGLRMIGLEQGPPGQLEAETVPAALAATVEDTVRRLAGQPTYFFEDESLLNVAVSEAFEEAVATNFPASLVRPDLRVAPTLGGTFVTRHAKQPYAYKKFSRSPEIDLTTAQAAHMVSFGGTTVDAALRASGITTPAKCRVYIFEAGAGTTLPRLARLERIAGGRRYAHRHLHPLTVANATALLREPKLGVDAAPEFLRSRHHIGVGQRFFYLEPIGQAAVEAPPPSRQSGCDATQPSDSRIRFGRNKSHASLVLFFSEADAQRLTADLATKPGSPAFLRALIRAVEASIRNQDHGHHAALHPHLRASAIAALSQWAKTSAQEFVRAAQSPKCGVTVVVHLRGLAGPHDGAGLGVGPAVAAGARVTVAAGRQRP